MSNDFLWSGTNDFETNFIAKLRNMLMTEKDNQPIFQFLCINLMENDSKITTNHINYAKTSKQLITSIIKQTQNTFYSLI